MARVIEAPKLHFKCHSCGATCEAEADEFRARHTMPPTWSVQCGYCRMTVICSPTPLIARLVGVGL
jgi:hypothetical protein